MWEHVSLKTRVYLILSILVFVTISGGVVTFLYTFQIDLLLNKVLNTHIASFQVAEALENSLINQKGFVSYYFIDGDPEWLRELGEHRQIFRERLKSAQDISKSNQTEKKLIDDISSAYEEYIHLKDQVIDHYKKGERKIGAKLHTEARQNYFKMIDLCEAYKNIHTQKIQGIKYKASGDAAKLRIIALGGVGIAFISGVMLLLVLIYKVMIPVRRLINETSGQDSISEKDEVRALSIGVHKLIEDSDTIHMELQRSRENLLQAEKMALVGKLAAGMAHSIRNPMTSVKMRLFSLGRSLRLSTTQKEDFDVISDEIRHMDTIVQNFLEFSRPPKLVMQSISPSVVVDLAIQLLKHRLKSYDVEVRVHRNEPLPEVQADPEQLKEVFVNIIVNACEAMKAQGVIHIHESVEKGTSGNMAEIKLCDTGPGLSEEIKEKLFQPFFTTKDEGTGLGLSIVYRIIQEHCGTVCVDSVEGEGATFIITFPIKESVRGENTSH